MHIVFVTLASLALFTACIAAPRTSDTTTPARESALPSASVPPVWPNGAQAAVSLTYDDALASHIDTAAPALRTRGLHATFFVTTGSSIVSGYADQWKALLSDGHELANHTASHPCTRSFSWVAKGNALEDFDDARMAEELNQSSTTLKTLGVQTVRAFAYPCGMSYVGEDHRSYVPLVKQRFPFARGVGQSLADPRTVDLHMTPAFDASQGDMVKLIADAEKNHAWLIIMFHGVGREHLNIALDQHERLLDELVKRRSSVWTAPFSDVAEVVRKVQSSGAS